MINITHPLFQCYFYISCSHNQALICTAEKPPLWKPPQVIWLDYCGLNHLLIFMFIKSILLTLLGWRERRSFKNRKKKSCWKNGNNKREQQASICRRSSAFISDFSAASVWYLIYGSFPNISISTVVRYGQRSTQSRPERGSAARLRHAGHSSDRDGRSDGSASGQNTGRDGHCCAKLLQSLSGEPHEVCRAGEEEENVVAGEKRRGEDKQIAFIKVIQFFFIHFM